MATPQLQNWDVRLANMLGIQPNPGILKFFHLWSQAEGGGAENNPFNTTQPGFNSIGHYNSVGVQRYGDPMSGLRATAATLKNGRYQNILEAMQSGDTLKMAQALANSPWGTGALVLKMLGQGGEQGQGGAPAPAQPGPSGGPPPLQGVPGVGDKLATLIQNAAPSQGSLNILSRLGGTAARAAQAAQAPIPLPQPIQAPQAPQSAAPQQPGSTAADPYQPVPLLPVAGATHGGSVPMIVGGNIAAKYPNLQVQGQVDWQHINPRLLTILQKEAEKRGISIVINSGYRSSAYNSKIGGAQNSNHMRGLAVDAYVNGHPIGDVIAPEEWARLGVRSGNTPGFFKGARDPEHLDLQGIPVKGGKR